MKSSFAERCLKPVIWALLCLSLPLSCSKDSGNYCKLVYEASSAPRFNMSVKMHYPGMDTAYGTAGATVRQDCGYVPEGYEASISADVIRAGAANVPDEVDVTVKIFIDEVCVAENTGTNSASVKCTVKSKE